MAAQTRNVDVPKRTGSAATRLGSWALLLLVACLVLASFAPIRMAFSQDDPQQKRTVPVPAKSVRTSNADATTAGNGEGWSAQTCAGTGDMVSYRLEATLPEDLEAFLSYSLWFNDQLDNGLAYVENSVHAYVARKNAKAVDLNLPVTFDGQTMRVGSDNIKALVPDLVPTDVITVEYDCTVRANATLGLKEGNANTLTLQYSNSPTQEGLAEHKVRPTATVYAFQIDLHKVGEGDGASLEGAEFAIQNEQGLYRTASGTWAQDKKDAQLVQTNSSGVASFAGLGEGVYTLTETTAPKGYDLLAKPVVVTLATSDVAASTRTLTASAEGNEAKVVAVDAGTGVATVQVEDPKSKLPTTPTDESLTPTDGSTTNSTNSPTSGNKTTSGTTTNAAASRTSTPTTGDRLPAVGVGVLVVATALVVAGVVVKRKRASSSDA